MREQKFQKMKIVCEMILLLFVNFQLIQNLKLISKPKLIFSWISNTFFCHFRFHSIWSSLIPILTIFLHKAVAFSQVQRLLNRIN